MRADARLRLSWKRMFVKAAARALARILGKFRHRILDQS